MSDEKVEYLTQQGYDELKQEYNNLKDNKIPAIATKIDEAKQQGDLSENAEYHQAKEEMAWAQGRLLELTQILENARVIDDNKQNGIVSVGNTVKFKVKGGVEKEYTIVGPQEADPLNGRISNESPIGQAFIGHKQGDSLSIETPSGTQEYKILEIK